MVKPVPSYLKLRTADSDVAPPDVEVLPGLDSLCLAFGRATGWPLRFAAGHAPADQIETLWSAPVDPGVGAAPGHLRIELGQTSNVEQLARRVPLEDAELLAAGISELLQQTCTLRKTLWKREAELAAGVPVAARPDEPAHLASRLETALRSGAQLIGCDAAALYTLDEATTELKLRSSFGLPFERLQQAARPLATALADLEALLGHAVALDNTMSLRPWNVPEACDAALCVPVSSPTMPLGTLWFFCRRPRDFTSEQTNLAEIIAGRLASELDRALLLHEQVQAVAVQRQLDDACRMQQHALNRTPPPLDGWQLAGWTSQAGPIGGAFHDWRLLADGRLTIIVADARDGGVAGAILAEGLRAALIRLLDAVTDPAVILEQLNEYVQSAGAGDQWAGIALAIINPASGDVTIASAGRPTALWLASEGPVSLLKPSLPLGLTESPRLRRGMGEDVTSVSECALETTKIPRQSRGLTSRRFERGDALIIYNRGFVESSDEQGRPLNESAVARSLFEARDRTAGELIEVLCDRQEAHALRPNQLDRSVVVLKRTL